MATNGLPIPSRAVPSDRPERDISRPSSAEPGPVPGRLGLLLERVYTAEVRRRNRRFDRGVGVRRVGVPVISVGNLSVGGTGKTPMVRLVVRWLTDAGRTPAIALRGYKARRGVSDEAAEYARELPGVPVAVGPDRVAAIDALRRTEEGRAIDCVVLDDGFQHRRLARSLDMVLMDATRWPLVGRCLPAGWLREPVDSLARAEVAIITRADRAPAPLGWPGLAEELARRFPSLLIGACEHRWEGFVLGPDTPGARVEPAGWLAGRAVVIACGIGNPGAFVGQALAHGAIIAHVVDKPDHHDWSAGDGRALAAALQRCVRAHGPSAALLTTGKDWVKLTGVLDCETRHAAAIARLSLRFMHGEQAIRREIIDAAASASG